MRVNVLEERYRTRYIENFSCFAHVKVLPMKYFGISIETYSASPASEREIKTKANGEERPNWPAHKQILSTLALGSCGFESNSRWNSRGDLTKVRFRRLLLTGFESISVFSRRMTPFTGFDIPW